MSFGWGVASRLRSPTGVPFVLYGAPPTFVLVGPVRFLPGLPFVFIIGTPSVSVGFSFAFYWVFLWGPFASLCNFVVLLLPLVIYNFPFVLL